MRPDYPPAEYDYKWRDVWLRVNSATDIEQTHYVADKQQWLTEPGELYVTWHGQYKSNTFRIHRPTAAAAFGIELDGAGR